MKSQIQIHPSVSVLSCLTSAWWCMNLLLGCSAEQPERSMVAPAAQVQPAPAPAPAALPDQGPKTDMAPADVEEEKPPAKAPPAKTPPAKAPAPQSQAATPKSPPKPPLGAPPGSQAPAQGDGEMLGGLGLSGVGMGGGGGGGGGVGYGGIGRGSDRPKSGNRPPPSDGVAQGKGEAPSLNTDAKTGEADSEAPTGTRPSRGGPVATPPASRAEVEKQKGEEEETTPDVPAPGQVMFNPPNRMRLGKAERVEVRVVQNTQTDLTQNLRGAGKPVVETHKVSKIMRVSLTGESFEINALSELEQVVAADDFTEWSFSVTPLESGYHPLHLAVTMVLDIPGRGEKAKTLPVIDRPIEVEVDSFYVAKAFAQENWEWLASGVLLPVAAWSAELVRRRKRRKGGEDSGEE